MLTDDNLVPLIVAILGAGGIGAFSSRGVSIYLKIRNGMSARESHRKNDLVAQRDREYQRAEISDRNRRRIEEHAGHLRRLLAELGATEIPPWPAIEALPASTTPTPLKETP
ncbi:hypothetical protein [Rathayibacter sp. Leaf248]|uniref:hypothetical protein n=1 Tax=Rathayibacter sp. Leaf248 TaxID=2876555 RepID=UPI001E4FCCF0|nr:hypothetical protein [Rathayibacter sp. Leaf248]